MYLTETQAMPQQLSSNTDRASFKRLIRLTPEFQIIDQHHNYRDEVQSYIQEKFQQSYGAVVNEFLDYLLSMNCPAGLSGVAGISMAADKVLFLEQYFDAPVEVELSQALGKKVERSAIVEIGNLVATTRGASVALFVILASTLYRAGYEHMVFTASGQLSSQFKKLGFETSAIKAANPECLSDNSLSDWGSYYDSEPEVLVGNLQEAMELISSRNLFSGLQAVFASSIDALVEKMPGRQRET